MKKSVFAVFLFLAALMCFSGCEKSESEEAPLTYGSVAEIDASVKTFFRKVSVILPNDRLNKWKRSGAYLKQGFDSWGFGCEVYYSDDSDEKQAEYILKSVQENVDVIILGACSSNSDALVEALDFAHEQNIGVIAYDNFVNGTEGIDLFITYDPYLSGRTVGLLTEAALLSIGGQPAFEFFGGNANDIWARFFYSGAMDVLLPHVDAGRIRVLSGLKSFDQTAFKSLEEAEGRVARIISGYYTGERLNASISADDSLALAVVKSLEGAGYSGSEGFPFIAGVGAHKENIIKMKEGKQAASVFNDERYIAAEIILAADSLIAGNLPQSVDKTTYFNGKVTIPAYLLEPVIVDESNYKDLLIGGAYYSYTDLNP